MAASWGRLISTSYGPRGVIAEPVVTPNGENVVIEVGNELQHDPGWTKVAHCVLTRAETLELIEALIRIVPDPPQPTEWRARQADAEIERLRDAAQERADLEGDPPEPDDAFPGPR